MRAAAVFVTSCRRALAWVPLLAITVGLLAGLLGLGGGPEALGESGSWDRWWFAQLVQKKGIGSQGVSSWGVYRVFIGCLFIG